MYVVPGLTLCGVDLPYEDVVSAPTEPEAAAALRLLDGFARNGALRASVCIDPVRDATPS